MKLMLKVELTRIVGKTNLFIHCDFSVTSRCDFSCELFTGKEWCGFGRGHRSINLPYPTKRIPSV